MRIEPSYGVTYKIHLDRSELPPKHSDRQLLRSVLKRLEHEYDLHIAEGEFTMERFPTENGCVILLTRRSPRRPVGHYACDIATHSDLGALCRALSCSDDPAEEIRVFISEQTGMSRILLLEPDVHTVALCREFGELTEITPLFAAQTSEQMSEVADMSRLKQLGEIL